VFTKNLIRIDRLAELRNLYGSCLLCAGSSCLFWPRHSLLYAFVIVRLGRRKLVWINVTANPTAEWIARQLTEAFPWDEPPSYLIRDRDCIYGTIVTSRILAMGIRDKPIAPAAPWQNGFADRLDPARVLGPFYRLGRGASAPDLVSLCWLLQRSQNAPVVGQRCASLSPDSADRKHQIALNPWRPSSPLCPGLGFRYTQG
jgi:hypothetical protein